MPNRRKILLDALENRLTGPKRIGLFGHRNVGKTTLLAMFYRQASTGQVPGLRLAAANPSTAEYLAEKIGQIESGESLAGTLSETELNLRLYRGQARFDIIVKDYQGEHITLGTNEPIQAFFADCDAVLLCLDPESSTNPADRRRRQQEIEDLLERYIDRSDDATAGRPIALILTKYDRVLASLQNQGGDDPSHWGVDELVEARYGMTLHALGAHVPQGAVFAVSSYGRNARDGRPPTVLDPLGLDRPLGWLAEQLETSDEAQLEWLWDLAPDDLPRLARCVAAYSRRYPSSDKAIDFRQRLKALRRKRTRRLGVRLAAGALALAGLAAGYDWLGYHAAQGFEKKHPAPAVAQRWTAFQTWHPTFAYFYPTLAHDARLKQAEWTVKAAGVQVELGTAAPDLKDRLTALKEQAPELAPAIKTVEQAQEDARRDRRWIQVRADALTPGDEPEKALVALRSFLRDYPESRNRAEGLALAEGLKNQAAAKASLVERRFLDDLTRAASLPGADFRDLIDRSQQFLTEHPESNWRGEVEQHLAGYVAKLDERDIDRARQYSRQYPTNFATRIERYQDYLKAHQGGGRYISEATEARDRILREWDTYSYRLAYDHLQAHPDDVGEVARRLRDYLNDQPDGRHAAEAKRYLDWWDKVSVPGEYRVTLRRGEVSTQVGKYLGGGGPDLGVTIEVAGIIYGPSPVVRNTSKPIWDYTFPRPIKWKAGDPVTIRILDYDWSDSVVSTLNTRKGDPLAMRNLSGTIRASKGGKTTLVFASNFSIPKLSAPE